MGRLFLFFVIRLNISHLIFSLFINLFVPILNYHLIENELNYKIFRYGYLLH